MNFSETLERLLFGNELTSEEARELMYATMNGALTPIQVASWLSALRTREETANEVSVFAEVLRNKAQPFNDSGMSVLDTCGTGGDRSGILNVSTLAAITLASMGIPVAKHGNRAVSSKSGSADLLENLGYPLNEPATDTAKRLKETNFAFLFAQNYHPAMKFAGPVRKEMGVRTVFNILGPLANPAKAKLHLLGVFKKSYISTMAAALAHLGTKYAMVVHSEDGLDEISPLAPTNYALLAGGKISIGMIDPGEYIHQIDDLSSVRCNSLEESVHVSKEILKGNHLEGIEMVALNAAAGYFLADLNAGIKKESMPEYLKEKKIEIETYLKSGAVINFLEKLK